MILTCYVLFVLLYLVPGGVDWLYLNPNIDLFTLIFIISFSSSNPSYCVSLGLLTLYFHVSCFPLFLFHHCYCSDWFTCVLPSRDFLMLLSPVSLCFPFPLCCCCIGFTCVLFPLCLVSTSTWLSSLCPWVLPSRPCCFCMLLVIWVFLPHSAVCVVVFSLPRFFPFPFQSEDAVRRMNSEIIIVNVNSLSPLSSCFHAEHSSLFGSDLTWPCSHAVQKDIFPWNWSPSVERDGFDLEQDFLWRVLQLQVKLAAAYVTVAWWRLAERVHARTWLGWNDQIEERQEWADRSDGVNVRTSKNQLEDQKPSLTRLPTHGFTPQT